MEKLNLKFNAGEALHASQLNQMVGAINEAAEEINVLAGSDVVNYITLDFTKTSPSTIVTGDINGAVIQWINNHSHRYLVKPNGTGKVIMAELADHDSTIFAADGSTAALDGSMGDVMMHLPHFYFHAEEIEADIWRIGFARIPIDSTWHEWNAGNLIGAYEAYVDGGKVYSRSGVASTGSVSQTNFKAYARARGEGYRIVTWEQHCIMCFLFYAKYGNTNCQAICGSGTNSYEKETGQTDALCMTDTNSVNGNTMSINFWGLENWWGNKYEWVDNVVVNPQSVNGVWRITDSITGSSREVQGPQSYDAWIYPKSLVVGQHLDAIGKTLGASTSSGTCDGQYIGSSVSRVVLRSFDSAYSSGGVACAYAGDGASVTIAFVGSRLAFIGNVDETTDIDAFKNL